MKPGTEPTFIPPLEANGKAIRYIDHGVWHTIARADSRGLFVPGSDEQNAAYLCHAANLYPELVEALKALVGVEPTCASEVSGDPECAYCGLYPEYGHTEDCPVPPARALLAKAGE